MKRELMKRILLLSALLGISGTAFAQRYVWINGEQMGPGQLARLDSARCGYVPNGRYWLNNRGIWGYWNNPRPQGHISDNCRGGGSGNAGGGNHALDRGTFGTYMSDGRCSFVNGVPVGKC